jgi:predicted PurR-regulated permease PerM
VTAGIVGALFAVPLAAVLWTAFSYLRGEEDAEGRAGPNGSDGRAAGQPAESRS